MQASTWLSNIEFHLKQIWQQLQTTNLGCYQLRMVPEIVFKLLHTAIWNGYAVQFKIGIWADCMRSHVLAHSSVLTFAHASVFLRFQRAHRSAAMFDRAHCPGLQANPDAARKAIALDCWAQARQFFKGPFLESRWLWHFTKFDKSFLFVLHHGPCNDSKHWKQKKTYCHHCSAAVLAGPK